MIYLGGLGKRELAPGYECPWYYGYLWRDGMLELHFGRLALFLGPLLRRPGFRFTRYKVPPQHIYHVGVICAGWAWNS